jgi:hypothetical protein
MSLKIQVKRRRSVLTSEDGIVMLVGFKKPILLDCPSANAAFGIARRRGPGRRRRP